jgi:tankyrase
MLALNKVAAWTLAALLTISGTALASGASANDRLIYSVRGGDLEGVNAALADGANVDYVSHPFKDATSNTALHTAAQGGYVSIIHLLVKHGANVNTVDHNGQTPLSIATFWNKKAAAEALLSDGANPNITENDASIDAGYSPLHHAVRAGLTDIVALLLGHGASVKQATLWDHAMPLDFAADAPTAKLLLDHGARIAGLGEDGKTPLQQQDRELFMAIQMGDLKVVRASLRRGAEVNVHNNVHRTPLIQAVSQGRPEIVAALLQNGADVNETDNDFMTNETPLHWAVAKGYYEITELLLIKGADPNLPGSVRKKSPIEYATNPKIVALLIKRGASAQYAFDHAFCGVFPPDNLEIVELLLAHDADPNHAKDCSPLLRTITFSDWSIVPTLLAHGADPNGTGKSDSNPLTMAGGAGQTAVVEALLQRGAQIDTPNADGDTALIEASRYGWYDIVKMLLDHGASVGLRDKKDLSALAVSKDIETMDALLARGGKVDDLVPLWFGDIKPTERQRSLLKLVGVNDSKAVLGITNQDIAAPDPVTMGPMLTNMAVSFGRITMLQWLLDHGADPNVADANGIVPLHRAALMGTRDQERQFQAMRTLITYGASVDLADENGWTALHMAAALHNKDVVAFLLSHGANPWLKTKEGRTPLQLAGVSTYGTAPLRFMTHRDIGQKEETVDVLNKALVRPSP